MIVDLFNRLPDDLHELCDPKLYTKLPKVSNKLLINPNLKKFNKAIDILVKIADYPSYTHEGREFKISRLILFYKAYCRWHTTFSCAILSDNIVYTQKLYIKEIIKNIFPILDKKEIINIIISLLNSSTFRINYILFDINNFLVNLYTLLKYDKRIILHDNMTELQTKTFLNQILLNIDISNIKNIKFCVIVNNFIDNILLNVPQLNFKEKLDNIIYNIIKNNIGKMCKMMYGDLKSMKNFYF